MLADVSIGKSKQPVPGQCLICNSKDTTFVSFGAEFCKECVDIMAAGDEKKLSERTVWT